MSNKKVWFVTGCSKGMGKALVEELIAQGYPVAGTSRSKETLEKSIGVESDSFLPLSMNVKDEMDVKNAIALATEKFDELIAIYSDDAESHSNDGSVSYGKEELIKNTRAFYDWMKGGGSRHFYNVTKEDGNIIEADWAVSAKLADGNVMALAGHNVYEFNKKHQIKKLVVTNK